MTTPQQVIFTKRTVKQVVVAHDQDGKLLWEGTIADAEDKMRTLIKFGVRVAVTDDRNGINHVLDAIRTIASHEPSPHGFTTSIHIGQLNANYVYGADYGRKFYKVWFAAKTESCREDNDKTYKSVVCFVDPVAGLIYQADSWKKRGRLLCTVDNLLEEADECRRDTAVRNGCIV